MKWSHWIRQAHRWLSVLFVMAVVANFVAMGMGLGPEAQWVGFLALVPLIPMLLTGIYLFILPYTAKRRAAVPTR